MKILGLILMITGALGDKAPYPPSGAPSGPYPPSGAPSGPYPPSGWKPSGPLLLLPQEQYGPPPPPAQPSEYGPPPTAPPSEYGPPQNETTPSTEEEDLEKVNERIMERLRKQEGSDTGVYYVYLPDGRLQRVQYTTAPLKAPGRQGQQSSFSNSQQSDQQAVFGNHQVSTQSNAQTFGGFSSFARQQTSYDAPVYPPASTPSQRFSQGSFQSAQFAQFDGTPKASEPIPEQPGSPNQLLAKFTKPDDPQRSAQVNQEPPQPNKYVASVSFTDVAPITGPVYSYDNQPLVRVLRYAPMFQ